MKLKKLILKLYFSVPARVREAIMYILSFLNISKYLKVNKINKINMSSDIYSNIEWGNYNIEKNIWSKNFKKLSHITDGTEEEIKCFYNDKIEIIKECNFKDDEVILVCLVKDDIIRIKKLIGHYKKIGVNNFAIIDNNSTDGTIEFLKEIENVMLFQVKEKYTTMRRQAWINRVISYFGLDKWYLIVDSDEFLCFNDMNSYNLNDLIKYYSRKNIKRARAMMIDMYPESFLLDNKNGDLDFMETFCYFDSDGYYLEKSKFLNNIKGGMRKRVFDITLYLAKYPLIFFDSKSIQFNSHYSYPFYENFTDELNLALLHYKFLPNDLEKIENIVRDKNFAGGSKEYKSYLEFYRKNPKMNLIYKNSTKLKSFDDIYAIEYLKEINWEEVK